MSATAPAPPGAAPAAASPAGGPDAAPADLRAEVEALPFWFHSLDLGGGVVTPGQKSPRILAQEWESLKLPDLTGKSVLDIGAWDGYFSFAAERAGAAKVTALDHFVWSIDRAAIAREEAGRAGLSEGGRGPDDGPGPPIEETEFWDPDGLPGKRPFDLARRALGSKVEAVAGDYLTAGPAEPADVVLYLGVLYHMPDPLGALRRVFDLTGELAVIETEAVALRGFEEFAVCEFYPFEELHGDPTNWWAPNAAGLAALCRAAGFRRVELVKGPESAARRLRRVARRAVRRLQGHGAYTPPPSQTVPAAKARGGRSPRHFRAMMHAWK